MSEMAVNAVSDVPAQPRAAESAAEPAQSPARLALAHLLHNKIAVASIGVLLAFALLAIAAPAIAPFDPYAAFPEDSLLPPSFTHPMGTDLIGRDIFSRVLFG